MGISGVEEERPMLATGKIVQDYRPLIKYLELISEDERTKVLPRSSDIEMVRALVEQGYVTLEEILGQVIQVVKDRFDPALSCRVIEEVLGLELEENEAVNYLAKLLAGWIIEIAERLGVINLKAGW